MENQSFVFKRNLTVLHSETASGSSKMEDAVSTLDPTAIPTIPRNVVQHFVNTAGLSTSDPQIVQVISLASEKFIADIVNEALEHMKMKSKEKSTKGNTHLTLHELNIALKEHGIDVKKPHSLLW